MNVIILYFVLVDFWMVLKPLFKLADDWGTSLWAVLKSFLNIPITYCNCYPNTTRSPSNIYSLPVSKKIVRIMESYGWPPMTSDHSISWLISALITTTLQTVSSKVSLTEAVQNWRDWSYMFMVLRALMRRFRMQHGRWYLLIILC